MFGWLKDRKRKAILEEPFPREWENWLRANVFLYAGLNDEERRRIHDHLRIFAAERDWEGCGGFEVTDEVKVTISGQASFLTLGRPFEELAHIRSILVYPETYWAPNVEEDDYGVVSEEIEDRDGEAWERGIVVLNWADVLKECRGRGKKGKNLVLHEMSHQMDLLDRVEAKAYPFEERETWEGWADTVLDEYETFCKRKARKGVLDPYGAEDDREFFAVATEAFFLRALELRKERPELYLVLRDYYRQDPAARGARQQGSKGARE
jgi:Mlc titration factor MtfA (ptsG expression regulator)